MKIYTKTGDQGETGLLGGQRVSKSHLAIETCGEVDELNCHIGWTISHSNTDSTTNDVRQRLLQIQNDLFDLGSRIAASQSEKSQPAELSVGRITQLESWIDSHQSDLPVLNAFILPGGGSVGSSLHLARAVCRRAERSLVRLMETRPQLDLSRELIYLNRLSDLLFVLARQANLAHGQPEILWQIPR